MTRLADLLAATGAAGALIGMVHVGALPGSPKASESIDALASRAVGEARMLHQAGFDAIIVENMHDTPYVHGEALGPEIVASMARICAEIRMSVSLSMGVQILSGGARQALAVAHASAGAMIRCENFVFSHVADEGLLVTAEAGSLLRYRRSIGAEHIAVLADIKKKHASHAITADIPIDEAARAAAFFGADGLIVSGVRTGAPADIADLRLVRGACELPIFVGSGVNADNIRETLELVSGVIVGSSIKVGGRWSNPVDPARCRQVIKAARG